MILLSLMLAAVARSQTAPIEVPFEVADDAMIVRAQVNGTPVSLLFDTGFGGSLLISDSIDIGPSSGTARLKDFVGQFDAKTVKVKNLRLGPLTMDPNAMLAIQQSTVGMSAGYNTHIDGLMGLQTIAGYVTEFDFQHKKLIFYPKSTDITKRTPNGKTTFLSKLLPIGNESLEMLVKTPSGRTMVMAVDTGNSYYATTHKDVLQRVGLWDGSQEPKYMKMSGIASGPVDSWSIQMPSLNVFGIPVPPSVWSVIDLPSVSAESDGTVGFQFLRNFNFTIDFDRRRIWFDNFTAKTANDPVAELGISGGYRDRTRKVEVWRVTPGGPADQAGIRKGDEILSIDNLDLESTTFRKFDSLTEGPVGSKVKLAISRNGELMRFELQRAFLMNDAKGS